MDEVVAENEKNADVSASMADNAKAAEARLGAHYEAPSVARAPSSDVSPQTTSKISTPKDDGSNPFVVDDEKKEE